MELSGIIHLMTRGETIKEEKVKTIVRNILPETLVLENYEPFPGYFGGNLPPDIKPMSVFIVLAKKYEPLHIGREMRKIASAREHPCDGTTAIIRLSNTNLYCIRIKNLPCFEDIADIQKAFVNNGFELSRHKNIDQTVLISVQKSFFLERLENGVFKDMTEPSQYYFSPGYLDSWDKFKKLTKIVKQNIPNNLFDAAFGYFWTLEGPENMVRIYEQNHSAERVNEITDYYKRAMERVQL